jgi:hypothetical protein
VRKKPPEGTLSYSESTYERLVHADPEPLQSRMRVTHAMVLNVLDQWEGQQQALRTLLLDNHEEPERRERLVERAVQVLGSLLRAGVVEPDNGSSVDDWLPPEAEGTTAPQESSEAAPAARSGDAVPDVDPGPDGGSLGALGAALADAGFTATPPAGDPAAPHAAAARDALEPEPEREPTALELFVRGEGTEYDEGPFQVAMDLHEGFALNQALSAFALAALDLLDPADPGYALDVVSVIEATLEDPRPVLMAQQFEARGEAVAAMKADGLEYEERMEALDDVTWPRPLADLLEQSLRTYRQTHPWVDPDDLRPKSVVRELHERAMTFGEFVAHHKLARAEGVVLRYLTDAYRALRSTVPLSARTEELDDLVEWLGEVVRQTDSSLLDEWEALANPDDEAPTEVRPSTEGRALTANPRALRVMVRQSMFRRVELLSRGHYEALAAMDGGLSAEAWQDAHAEYLTEYDDIGTGPAARGPALFRVTEEAGHWVVEQLLDDPEGDHDWRITAELDLAATDEQAEPVLVVTGLAPVT